MRLISSARKHYGPAASSSEADISGKQAWMENEVSGKEGAPSLPLVPPCARHVLRPHLPTLKALNLAQHVRVVQSCHDLGGPSLPQKETTVQTLPSVVASSPPSTASLSLSARRMASVSECTSQSEQLPPTIAPRSLFTSMKNLPLQVRRTRSLPPALALPNRGQGAPAAEDNAIEASCVGSDDTNAKRPPPAPPAAARRRLSLRRPIGSSQAVPADTTAEEKPVPQSAGEVKISNIAGVAPSVPQPRRSRSASQPSAPVSSAAKADAPRVQQDPEALLTRRLVDVAYGEHLSDKSAAVVTAACPEITWLVQCMQRAPQPPGWHQVYAASGGQMPRYKHAQTGEISKDMPLLSRFAKMAQMAYQARQTSANPDAAAGLRSTRDETLLESIRVREGWAGPHFDPDSGADYYHHPESGLSSWGNPSMAYTFIAHVANELLRSKLFPQDTAGAVDSLEDLAKKLLRSANKENDKRAAIKEAASPRDMPRSASRHKRDANDRYADDGVRVRRRGDRDKDRESCRRNHRDRDRHPSRGRHREAHDGDSRRRPHDENVRRSNSGRRHRKRRSGERHRDRHGRRTSRTRSPSTESNSSVESNASSDVSYSASSRSVSSRSSQSSCSSSDRDPPIRKNRRDRRGASSRASSKNCAIAPVPPAPAARHHANDNRSAPSTSRVQDLPPPPPRKGCLRPAAAVAAATNGFAEADRESAPDCTPPKPRRSPHNAFAGGA